MMPLADTVTRCRSGVFQIVFADNQRNKVGGGSAFLSRGYLITNHHVFLGYQRASEVGVRRDDMPAGQYRTFTPQDFASRLVTGSQEHSYDYAILRIPELITRDDHQFDLAPPERSRIGDPIALLGFPLEHDNLTCHQGVISSFYVSGVANVVQIDASVNAGNSGGPLINPETGIVLGYVTRKATGLTRIFSELRRSVQQNLQVLETASRSGGMRMFGVNPFEVFIASQNQMLQTFSEIERQANVGIGYAFSASHLLAEDSLR